MRIDWRAAGGLLVAGGAILGTILGISLVTASGDSDAAQYEVTVLFNRSVTQESIDEAEAILRSFDRDLEFIVMESFPPIGRAVVASDAPDFCGTIEAALGAEEHIGSVSCQPSDHRDVGDADAPVSTNSGLD